MIFLLNPIGQMFSQDVDGISSQVDGTKFSRSNPMNIRYVTANWNWAQTPTDNLSVPGRATIHLSPCPLGIDTVSSSNHYSYKVYISGTGTAEPVGVIGGACIPGASSGTIIVSTAYAHGAGYTVGSASTGIQEAWNDAWTNDIGAVPNANSQTAPYVKLEADRLYSVYAAIYLRGRGGVLDGVGALIACSTRDRCIYIGTTANTPAVNYHKLYNLSMGSRVNVDGVQVSSVSAASGTYTVKTASPHSFVAGDTVDCEYYSQTTTQHIASVVLPAGLTEDRFEFQSGGNTFSAGAATFGFCGLLNAAIEDNSDHVAMQDINLFQSNPAAKGYFSFGIVNDNDQQLQIERLTNRSSLVIKSSANFPNGALVYQRNDWHDNGITYIHNAEITGVNCATGGGNGFVIEDSVCQGFPVYGTRYFGALQPATYTNMYQESTGGSVNPLYGYAAQLGILTGGGGGSRILGTFPISGLSPFFANGGGTSTLRNYYVVPRSSSLGAGPVLFIGSAEPKGGSLSIPLRWPSVELQNAAGRSVDTLTWDVLVTLGTTAKPLYGTGKFAIATGVSGSCTTNGMCSYTDTQAPPKSYTVAGQQFEPQFWFWPATYVNNAAAPIYADQVGTNATIAAAWGTQIPEIVALECVSGGEPYTYAPARITCLESDSGLAATQLRNNPATAANSKGRINFGPPLANLPNDLITLGDSNSPKTLATGGYRPSNDTGDIAIGLDQSGGLVERAPTSISEVINAVPTGSNWLERLTNIQKSFKVPIATPPAVLKLSTTPIGPGTCRTQALPIAGVTATSVIKWSFATTPIGLAGYGNGSLQLSSFPTLNTANIVVCNISMSPIKPDAISLNIRIEL
jgi:hypothetical protein